MPSVQLERAGLHYDAPHPGPFIIGDNVAWLTGREIIVAISEVLDTLA